MPTFNDSIFEIRVRQDVLGQEGVNVYYYRDLDLGPSVGIAQIALQFNADVQRSVEGIQSDQVFGNDIRVRKLGGTVEETVDISTQFGERMGEPAASFTAWGFIYVRTTIDIRNGAKRIAGVAENDTNGNLPDAAFVPELDIVAAALGANLELSNGAELDPVIFRRGSFVDPDWFGGLISGVSFTRLTSQNSRKQTTV